MDKQRRARLREQERSEELEEYEDIQWVTLKCLRCAKEFQSWDRKLNRICDKCFLINQAICLGFEPPVLTGGLQHTTQGDLA